MKKSLLAIFSLSLLITLMSCGKSDVLNDFNQEPFVVNVTSKKSPKSFSKKLLLEKITATWCGACPKMGSIIESAVNRNNNIIPVAVHKSDAMAINESSVLASMFYQRSFPHGQLNRVHHWSSWSTRELDGMTKKTSQLGVSIATKYEDSTIKGVLKYGVCSTLDTELSYVIYVLESGLNYHQSGGSSIHKHVLRKCLTDVKGNKIPDGYNKKGKVYSVAFEWLLDANKYKHKNIEIVAFIIKRVTGEVMNVQKVKLGSSADFD